MTFERYTVWDKIRDLAVTRFNCFQGLKYLDRKFTSHCL